MSVSQQSRHQQGFTLMEMMISLALLSMVMVVVSMSLDTGHRFNDRFSRQTDINNRANDVLNKLAMQLRMASAGDSAATSLELPGAYPYGLYQPRDPSKPGNVKAYYYAVSTGLGNALNDWKEQYEPFKRMIIYDYSVTPGRLLLQPRDSVGNLMPSEILSDEVAEDGFKLTRIGNTLQMSLTLRSETRVEEEIIYTALAQTLFLRSTLNESSGSSAVTHIDSPLDADGIIAGFTTGAPAVMFGNLVTDVNTKEKQISLFITAPVGKRIDPKTIVVTIGDATNAVSSVVDEGSTVSVPGADVTRATQPAVDQASRNGTYSVTLTGTISGTVTVTASAANTDGEKIEEAKRYDPN